MERFWWVNHKQTHTQEINGGYIWSPKTERDGKRSHYYENMRRARPNDSIISYAGGAVQALGRIVDAAILAPRPEEFGLVGLNWADQGWLAPVSWTLINPIKPKSILGQIAHLLPNKYSPLQAATGNGNQKAYLTEVSQQIFELLVQICGATVEELSRFPEVCEVDFRNALDAAEERKISADLTLTDTEKVQLSKARRGQGLFRKNLCGVESQCRLTNVHTPKLLIASHIKPWRLCTTAYERLDGNNGLLLTAHVDHLFDRGLISFGHDGTLLVSTALAPSDFTLLGLTVQSKSAFNDAQLEYLKFHRENVFQT